VLPFVISSLELFCGHYELGQYLRILSWVNGAGRHYHRPQPLWAAPLGAIDRVAAMPHHPAFPLASLLSGALLACACWALPAAAQSPADLPGKTVLLEVKPDPWQLRRKEVIDLVSVIVQSNYKDKAATEKFEKILRNFDQDFVSITPMEGMDLQRIYYVPMSKPADMESNLGVVAALATLGWYDALRFADESGRAEIQHNESFFLRAFTAPGSTTKDAVVAFLSSHPQEAQRAVKMGTDAARTVLSRIHYDVHWPTSYGLLRSQCALQGGKNCTRPAALPQAQWPAAFEEAVALTTRYYRDNSTPQAKK